MNPIPVRDRAAVLAKDNAVPLSEPCASCGEKCCNRFAVPLTGFDVVRILDHVGGEAGEFCELAHSGEIEAAPHALVFLFDKEGKMQERLLALRRMKNNYCVFSRHSRGCSIWGAHPMVCRAYPFALKEGGKLGYTKNMVCPRPWEMGEYNEKNVRSVLDVMHREIEEYGKIVREWNATRARMAGKKEKVKTHTTSGYEASEKAFFAFLISASKKKMKDWAARSPMADPLALPSLAPKRGFMEKE